MRILLILLIFPFSVFSQTDIEQIRNDSDVVNFIRAVGHEYFPYAKSERLRDVSFGLYGRFFIYREKLSEADGKFTDSITAKRWIVEDFNNDKLRDLVYYGRIGNEAGIYVFFGGALRSMTVLTDLFATHYPHSISLYKTASSNAIIVGSLEQPDDFRSKQKPFADRFYHDTLVYKFGGFAEYREEIKKGPAFDSIQFRPLSNWATGNNWYIRIFKDGSVIYVRSRDSAIKDGSREYFVEKLAATVNPHEWQDMLDYIGFAYLDDSFALRHVFDLTIAVTKVAYQNGSRKTVWDYGMTGTYGLETLYAKMYMIIKTARWQVVARRKGMLAYREGF